MRRLLAVAFLAPTLTHSQQIVGRSGETFNLSEKVTSGAWVRIASPNGSVSISQGTGTQVGVTAEKAWAGSGDYTALQDYIFRFIATECGRLGMGIHLHVAHGGGGYFNTTWANPMLLEPLLNDPALRKTNFVMIHGGWPYTRELTPLLTKPNAYLDFSEQTAYDTPHNVAEALRGWLAYVPEKVLFASDAYPASQALGWEESGLIASNSSREALGRAFSAMMRDGEITRQRAVELATMVLRDNARKLYGLK